jgi:hypothetical protein
MRGAEGLSVSRGSPEIVDMVIPRGIAQEDVATAICDCGSGVRHPMDRRPDTTSSSQATAACLRRRSSGLQRVRSARADAEAQMAGMPDNDKLLMFDRKREILLSMAENIEHATPVQLQVLVAQLVERVETADRRVTRVDPSGEAVLRGRRGRYLRLGCVVVVPPGAKASPRSSRGMDRAIVARDPGD